MINYVHQDNYNHISNNEITFTSKKGIKFNGDVDIERLTIDGKRLSTGKGIQEPKVFIREDHW